MTVGSAPLPDGKILDFIDEKIINNTPKECVRQNIERRLVLELGYVREQIAAEFPVKMGEARVGGLVREASRPRTLAWTLEQDAICAAEAPVA